MKVFESFTIASLIIFLLSALIYSLFTIPILVMGILTDMAWNEAYELPLSIGAFFGYIAIFYGPLSTLSLIVYTILEIKNEDRDRGFV